MPVTRLASIAGLGALLCGCAGAPVILAADVAAAAVKAGVEYAERNRPSAEQALGRMRREELRRRAERGDVEAQFELARALQAEASAEAEHWMCRAANQAHARAQLVLGHWYNEDRAREDLWPYIRVRPDDRQAFVWYSLAATNGDAFAPHFRRRLLDGPLDAGEVDEATARLDGWQPSGCGAIAAAGGVEPESRR